MPHVIDEPHVDHSDCNVRSKTVFLSHKIQFQRQNLAPVVLVYFWFSYNTIFLSSVNQLSLSHFLLVEGQQFLEFPVTSN